MTDARVHSGHRAHPNPNHFASVSSGYASDDGEIVVGGAFSACVGMTEPGGIHTGTWQARRSHTRGVKMLGHSGQTVNPCRAPARPVRPQRVSGSVGPRLVRDAKRDPRYDRRVFDGDCGAERVRCRWFADEHGRDPCVVGADDPCRDG